MNKFISYHPTELFFGDGSLNSLGDIVSQFGQRALLIRTPLIEPMRSTYDQVERLIRSANVELHCFDGVEPNPTTSVISKAALQAKAADMMMAATLGGMAIAETDVTLPHGMGMAIGGYCHQISHGASMAIVYPDIIAQSVTEGGERYANVARLFEPSLNKGAAQHLPQIITELLQHLNIDKSLCDYGVQQETLADIAKASFEQPGWEEHPKVHSQTEMLNILERSF